MFQFENEQYLWGLVLVPMLYFLFWMNRRWRQKAIERFGEQDLVSRLVPDFSERKQGVKIFLYLLTIVFIVIALANPQLGSQLEKVQRKGIDVMVAIDVSKSMMAEDVQPTRLDRAKQLLSRLIDGMSNDRIGIIVFAGHAYLQMPLTVDYAAAKLFLQTINTDIVPTQGTAIGEAIELSRESFEEESEKNRALIIISDGENHEEGAIEKAEEAANEGIKVFALGVGSVEGSSIPVYMQGRKVGYKQDRSGQLVVSKLNEEVLKEIAQKTGGKYFLIKGARNEIAVVIDELNNIEKRDFEDYVFTDYADQFQYFIGFAVLLMILGFFTSERKSGWFSRWKLFE
ncbi:MAG: VWA domain-containing protein [Chitinophagales bacterium]